MLRIGRFLWTSPVRPQIGSRELGLWSRLAFAVDDEVGPLVVERDQSGDLDVLGERRFVRASQILDRLVVWRLASGPPEEPLPEGTRASGAGDESKLLTQRAPRVRGSGRNSLNSNWKHCVSCRKNSNALIEIDGGGSEKIRPRKAYPRRAPPGCFYCAEHDRQHRASTRGHTLR